MGDRLFNVFTGFLGSAAEEDLKLLLSRRSPDNRFLTAAVASTEYPSFSLSPVQSAIDYLENVLICKGGKEGGREGSLSLYHLNI